MKQLEDHLELKKISVTVWWECCLWLFCVCVCVWVCVCGFQSDAGIVSEVVAITLMQLSCYQLLTLNYHLNRRMWSLNMVWLDLIHAQMPLRRLKLVFSTSFVLKLAQTRPIGRSHSFLKSKFWLSNWIFCDQEHWSSVLWYSVSTSMISFSQSARSYSISDIYCRTTLISPPSLRAASY